MLAYFWGKLVASLCEHVHLFTCPVSWGCRIYQLHLCWELRTPIECPGYDIKLSDGEAPALVIVEYPFLAIAPGPLWLRVVAPDRVLSVGHIKWTVCKQRTDVKLWLLYSNAWDHLTVCKKELRLV